MRKKQWRPFEEARKFARSLKLKNLGEWMEYSKSGERPSDIPSNPHTAYKNDGWKSLADFLGNWRTRVDASRRASFEKARKFVRSLKLKSSQEWHEYCKSGKKSDDIPADAYRSYINKGWKSWDDFLGVKKIRKYTKDNTRPFNEAREFVHSLKLKNQMDWKKYLKSGKKPDDIPAAPREIYKEYKSDGDWLGTGTIRTRDREYRSYNESRKFARNLGLKSRTEWEDYCKSGEKPDDIPMDIFHVYPKEFTSMGDFLGNETIANQVKSKTWLPIKEAKVETRKIVKELGIKHKEHWIEAHRAGKIPKNLPSDLRKVYGGRRKRK